MLLAVIILSIPLSFAAYPHAYNVVVTKDYVMSTALPSSSHGNAPYKYATRVFENFNPVTGKWGGLNFVRKSYEGQWTYTIKDTHYGMDFCMVTGYEKLYGSKVHLVPYNGVINGKIVKNGYFTGKTAETEGAKTPAVVKPTPAKPSSTVTIGGYKVNKVLPYTLKPGLRNDKYVKVTQKELAKKVKYDGYQKGNYASKTVTSVKKFQKKSGLKQTGTVDKKTWTALIK